MLISLPLLISNENCPDDVFVVAISHLKLSADPLGREPLAVTGLKLFISSPSEIVFNTKDCFWYWVAALSCQALAIIPLSFGPAALPEVNAEVNEPVTTLVTNNDSPPFAK